MNIKYIKRKINIKEINIKKNKENKKFHGMA